MKPLQEPASGLTTVVFSRKKDESIVINDNEIVVTVVKIGADEVWLRTEASKKVAVNRRKLHESVNISENVLFTVVEIRGDSVRLAFKAPKEVRVHRREVYEAIKRQMSEKN